MFIVRINENMKDNNNVQKCVIMFVCIYTVCVYIVNYNINQYIIYFENAYYT